MCNAFSCIVLKNGTVSWKFGVDSHDKILELNNIPDNTADADKVKFCRVEISPANKNYLNPDKWIFKIDQIPIPNWMEEEHELACWDAFRFWKQELDRILVYKPIIHPFEIEPPEITDEHIALLREWASVRDSVWDSVGASVRDSVGDSIWASVRASIWASVRDSVGASVLASVRDSVGASIRASVLASVLASVRDSVGASVGSFFSLPRESWKYTEKIETNEYPFQSAVTLLKMGLVPSFDGKLWRLHSKNGIVWEGKI
jgi:hypothetical protein